MYYEENIMFKPVEIADDNISTDFFYDILSEKPVEGEESFAIKNENVTLENLSNKFISPSPPQTPPPQTPPPSPPQTPPPQTPPPSPPQTPPPQTPA